MSAVTTYKGESMLKKIIFVLLCFSMSLPALADNHMEESGIEVDTTRLTSTQRDALKSYKAEIKALREKKKNNKASMKEKWEQIQAQKHNAFIEGDFKSIANIKAKMMQEKHVRMEEMRNARIEAMEKSFSSLSKEDRQALSAFVIDKKSKRNMKRKEVFKSWKEKRKAKKAQRRNRKMK